MADTVDSSVVVSGFSRTVIDGGITAPAGFQSAAIHCGIKARAGVLDLVVLAADKPAAAAALFTTNIVKAAPVLVSQQHLERSKGWTRAIVVNSGCANACTGDKGMQDAVEMAAATAKGLGCGAEEVLVSSTGVIGVQLKMDRVLGGIKAATGALARGKGEEAARAIMTTDLSPKSGAVEVSTARGTFRIGGMAKGAGMIEPMMATMLGFITTDADVPPALLQRALREAAKDTFNAITVDGEASTNDSLFALASGASGVRVDEDLYPALVEGLLAVARPLALDIVRGGEGATKLIAVNVHGARTEEDARRVARTIANSPLVKTAVHGADPTWGRILAAAGRSGTMFDVQRVTVRVGGVRLFENGLPHDEAAPQAAEHLKGKEITIDVGLGEHPGSSATVWTCDLSAEYVRINGEYRT